MPAGARSPEAPGSAAVAELEALYAALPALACRGLRASWCARHVDASTAERARMRGNRAVEPALAARLLDLREEESLTGRARRQGAVDHDFSVVGRCAHPVEVVGGWLVDVMGPPL